MGSKIEWTDETWPVITGCSPESEGCPNCYAARMAATRLKHHPRYAGLAEMVNSKPRWTGEVRLNYDVFDQPHRWRKPRMVFVASMGDLFHEDVPFRFIDRVFHVVELGRQHTFQILTKRPKRMLEYMTSRSADFPLPNVWLGVTAENQKCADERIPLLLQMPATVRFVSCEPLLELISLLPYLPLDYEIGLGEDTLESGRLPGLDWVIVGGESGPDARPMHPYWARSLRDQCQAAGIPFFFKQWGEWLANDEIYPMFGSTKLMRGRIMDAWGRMFWRVGKKAAGRLLDGRIWDEMPIASIALER